MRNDEALALVESIDKDTGDAFSPDRVRLYRKTDLTRFALRCLDEIERLQREVAWKQAALDQWKQTAHKALSK